MAKEKKSTAEFEGSAADLPKSTKVDLNKIPLTGPKNTRVAGTGDYGLYYDSRGFLTGGIGHKVKSQNDAQRFVKGDKETADLIFSEDKAIHFEAAKKIATNKGIDWETLPTEVQEVLQDMTFNLGETEFSKWNNTFKLLKKDAESGDFSNFANKLESTSWYKQVGNRAKTHIKTLKEINMERDPQTAPSFDETEEVNTDVVPSFDETEDVGTQMRPREDASIGAPNVPKPGALESSLTGFLDAIPGAKQASAGIKAISDTTSDLSLSKKYRMYLGEEKLDVEASKREHPYAFMAGEATSLVGGGAGLAKGAVKIPKVGLLFTPKKGVTFADKAVGYSQVLGRNVLADTALVGAKQIADAEAYNLKDAGEIAGNVFMDQLTYNLVGGATSLAANAVVAPASYGAQRLLNSETAKLMKNYVQGRTKTAATKLNGLYSEYGSDFVESTLKKAEIDKNNFTPELFKEAVNKRKNVIGEALSNSYDEMDAALGGKKIPISDLYENLNLAVKKYYSKGGTEVEQQAAEKLMARLKKEFFTADSLNSVVMDASGKPIPQALVPIEKSVSQIWGFRKVFNEPTLANKMLGQKIPPELQDIMGGEFTKFLKRAPHAVGDVALDAGEKVAKEGAETVNRETLKTAQKTIDELNKEYRVLLNFTDNVVDGLKVPTSDTLKAAFSKNLFSAVSLTGVGVSAYAGMFSSPGSGVLALGATGAIAAIRTVKDNADLVIKELGDGPNSVLAKTARLADQMYKNFNDPYISQLIPSLINASQNEALSDEEFEDMVYDYNSRVNLYSNPISRNDEAVKDKLDDIINVSARVAPELSEAIIKRRQMGEDMGDIFDQMSKLPEMSRFFEPGQGWNGRLYSEEDKAAAIKQVQGLYLKGNLPAIKKREMENQIRSTGVIPSELGGIK